MKKLLLISGIALSAFAFPGMQGNGMSMGKAHNMAPMKGLTSNKVLAKVNGKEVTVKDVNAYLHGMTKDYRIKLQNLPAQHVGEFVKQYVETLALYNKAKPITNTPAYKALVKKIAVDLWVTQQYNKIKISDSEAKAFYEKNKDIYFKKAPEYKARHILLKDEKTAKKIIAILSKTPKAKIESEFAKLAKQYSIGPSKIEGGELGFFALSDMTKPFSNAVKQMKVGEFSKTPVKTQYGYHIILLEAKKAKVYIPFNKVKNQIVAYLKQQKLNQELANIKKEAKVKYFIKTK